MTLDRAPVIALALLATMIAGAGATDAPPGQGPASPRGAPPAAGASAPHAAPPATVPAEGGTRQGRRFGIENLTAEQIDDVIEVAAEISPEWGKALRERRAEDPQKLREAIASGGPRLLGLAFLKRQHPELYSIRIEDLRLQNELKRLAGEYRAALESGSAKVAELEAALKQKVGRQVDLDLRARAIELKALDAQLRRMVDDLTQEARDRGERVEKVLESIKAGDEPKPLVRPGFGGDRGGRSWRGPGGDGREERRRGNGAPPPASPATPGPAAPSAPASEAPAAPAAGAPAAPGTAPSPPRAKVPASAAGPAPGR